MQHTPSAQKPETHWPALVHAWPITLSRGGVPHASEHASPPPSVVPVASARVASASPVASVRGLASASAPSVPGLASPPIASAPGFASASAPPPLSGAELSAVVESLGSPSTAAPSASPAAPASGAGSPAQPP